MRPGEQVEIRVERAGRPLVAQGPARGRGSSQDDFGQRFRIGLLGIRQPHACAMSDSASVELLPAATGYTLQLTRSMIDGLWQIITGQPVGQGPRRAAQDGPDRRTAGKPRPVSTSFSWSRSFSINLGFINLLPVPMLDGGHLVFYAVEAVRRRPVSERAQEWAFRGGLAAPSRASPVHHSQRLGSFGLLERLGRLIG